MKTDITKASVEFDQEFEIEYRGLTIWITELWAENDISDDIENPRFDWDGYSARADVYLGDDMVGSRIFDFAKKENGELEALVWEGLKHESVTSVVDAFLDEQVSDYLEYRCSLEVM